MPLHQLVPLTHAAAMFSTQYGAAPSVSRLRRWVKEGRLPATREAGRLYVSYCDLCRLLLRPLRRREERGAATIDVRRAYLLAVLGQAPPRDLILSWIESGEVAATSGADGLWRMTTCDLCRAAVKHKNTWYKPS